MEAYSLSSKRHFVSCTCTTSFSFNFDWSYPITRVSSGDKKGAIFFLTFASSFMWCGQFFSGRSLYCHDFYFEVKPYTQIQNPPGATSILPVFVGTISKYDVHSSRYQHTKFRTCMKNRTAFAVCHSTIRTY